MALSLDECRDGWLDSGRCGEGRVT